MTKLEQKRINKKKRQKVKQKKIKERERTPWPSRPRPSKPMGRQTSPLARPDPPTPPYPPETLTPTPTSPPFSPTPPSRPSPIWIGATPPIPSPHRRLDVAATPLAELAPPVAPPAHHTVAPRHHLDPTPPLLPRGAARPEAARRPDPFARAVAGSPAPPRPDVALAPRPQPRDVLDLLLERRRPSSVSTPLSGPSPLCLP